MEPLLLVQPGPAAHPVSPVMTAIAELGLVVQDGAPLAVALHLCPWHLILSEAAPSIFPCHFPRRLEKEEAETKARFYF